MVFVKYTKLYFLIVFIMWYLSQQLCISIDGKGLNMNNV